MSLPDFDKQALSKNCWLVPVIAAEMAAMSASAAA
jgi:hypothetical protein